MSTEIQVGDFLTPDIAEALNKCCHCVSVDTEDLRNSLGNECAKGAAGIDLLKDRPHLFAAPPVFLARSQVWKMQSLVDAIERVVALPAWQQTVLSWAPEIALHDVASKSVFLGYDFHLTPQGPQLIEINTNAGGAMLNAALLRAARACCVEVETLTPSAGAAGSLGTEFVKMFETEWRHERGDAPLKNIAIVDEAPETQYLYPEFLLFQDLLARAGYGAIIVAPEALEYRDGKLMHDDLVIDLVYNRLTDFELATEAASAIRSAYLEKGTVVTPHPRAHALYADKRNLALLSDSGALTSMGADDETVAILASGIPRTEIVSAENAERLWSERKKLFFKPMKGFGSRGAYRGDKLTKRVWDEIIASDYIAQAYMPPSERIIGDAETPIALKADFRNYVYAGNVQLIAARLYQGQTTNFRTPGGGFAPVFSPKDEQTSNEGTTT